jgi:hypothetical protein
MNEQTTKLVEQLAIKLGTTADYLWSVLLKQAPISALTDLIYFMLISIGGIILFKTHKSFSKPGEDTWENKYDKSDGLVVAMGVIAVIWVLLFIVAFLSLGNVINGFFNPEYWALNQILSNLK